MKLDFSSLLIVALVVLSLNTTTATVNENCSWQWVIEETLYNPPPQENESTSIRCAGDPPEYQIFKKSVDLSRASTTNDHNISRFVETMRENGWPNNEPLYKLKGKNAIVHSSIKGTFGIGDVEFLCAVVSIKDTAGEVIRWEGWNVNFPPYPSDMPEERNIYINPDNLQESPVDKIELTNMSIEKI